MPDRRLLAAFSGTVLALLSAPALPQEDAVEEIVVAAEREGGGPDDPFGLLSRERIDTVLGLGKSLHETPRAAASVSERVMDLYGIERVTDFASILAGTYTASFFGLATSMEMRGSQGDLHFRGMRRLTSAGGWVSVIGATTRVDVVRGPATPIHGPSSISGYINFVPKTARADEERFIDRPVGEIALATGSWEHLVLEVQRGGPATVFGKPAGYHVFALVEDSGRFYDVLPNNTQRMLQSSLVLDVRDDIWIEAGQQYQRWRGAEVAGWNRLDQTLVDEGLYLSGHPLVDLDANRDGVITQPEVRLVSPDNRLAVFSPYRSGMAFFADDAEREALQLDPDTLRRVGIDASDCICNPDDAGEATSSAAYMDVFAELDRVTIRQKLFIDYADRLIVTGYGFGQTHETLLVEDRVEFAFETWELGEAFTADIVVAPNVRYYDTRGRQDFAFEYFDRRDISKPPTHLDRRSNAVTHPHTDDFNTDVSTESWNLGLGALADVTWRDRVALLLGLRGDRYDVTSLNGPRVHAFNTPNESASSVQDDLSWSLSVSLNLGPWRPYVTTSSQALVVGGQSGEIPVSNVRGGPLVASRLREAGIKYQAENRRLQAQLNAYEQRRTDYSAFTGTNLAVRGEGVEIDLRAVPTERLALFFVATRSRIYRDPLVARYIFAPPSVTGLAPEAQYGGVVGTMLPGNDPRFRERGALPRSTVGIGGSYRFGNVTVNVSASRVGEAWSGVGRSVRLPAYTLVNASALAKLGAWEARLGINNALDELYFQGNFPEIFGDAIVLPQLPRHWRLTLTRRFGEDRKTP